MRERRRCPPTAMKTSANAVSGSVSISSITPETTLRMLIACAGAVAMAALGLLALNALLALGTYRLLKSGWKIKN